MMELLVVFVKMNPARSVIGSHCLFLWLPFWYIWSLWVIVLRECFTICVQEYSSWSITGFGLVLVKWQYYSLFDAWMWMIIPSFYASVTSWDSWHFSDIYNFQEKWIVMTLQFGVQWALNSYFLRNLCLSVSAISQSL